MFNSGNPKLKDLDAKYEAITQELQKSHLFKIKFSEAELRSVAMVLVLFDEDHITVKEYLDAVEKLSMTKLPQAIESEADPLPPNQEETEEDCDEERNPEDLLDEDALIYSKNAVIISGGTIPNNFSEASATEELIEVQKEYEKLQTNGIDVVLNYLRNRDGSIRWDQIEALQNVESAIVVPKMYKELATFFNVCIGKVISEAINTILKAEIERRIKSN